MSDQNVSNSIVPYSPSSVASRDSSSPVPGNASVVDLTLDSGANAATSSTSVAIQTSLVSADSDAHSGAVIQAIIAPRPETTERACNTSCSRIDDHFSRELVFTLSKDDPDLSLIMDCLSTNRREAQKKNLRAKLPEHWHSLLPSLHVADNLLFLDERLVMRACIQKVVTS